ncbi:hypothetical protein D9M69_704520 [compost metagenome]
MGAEAAFIDLRQAHLADGGARLQFVDIGGALLETEAQHAFGDGAGADEHDFLAQGAQAGNLRGPARNGGMVESAAIVGNQRGADFDDDAGSFLNHGIHGAALFTY